MKSSFGLGARKKVDFVQLFGLSFVNWTHDITLASASVHKEGLATVLLLQDECCAVIAMLVLQTGPRGSRPEYSSATIPQHTVEPCAAETCFPKYSSCQSWSSEWQ